MRAEPSTGLFSFPSDGGAIGEAIRSRDWSKSPLGPLDNWPVSLRTVLTMMLDSPESMALVWGPGRLFFFNDAYRPAIGERAEATLGRPVTRVWPEAWARFRPMAEKAFAGESSRFVDVPGSAAGDGVDSQAWWSFSFSPVRDETGHVAGVLSVITETTARVRAADALRRSETRNRQILDSATDYAIVATDFDGHVTQWNEGASRILGWTEAEMLGQPIDRFFTPEDVAADRVAVEMRKARETGHGNDEGWHLRKSGERFWAIGEMTVLRDESGEEVGFVKVLRDRTEQRRAEQALQESEAELRALNADLERQVVERTRERGRLWQVSPDLLSVISANGVFESTNPAWKTVLGWTADDLRVAYVTFLHPDDVASSAEAFERAKRGIPVLRFENRYRNNKGDYRWLSWVAVLEDGKIYCSARDITIEKTQAEALRQAEENLRQSQKMEAVGQLTGGLAHDFNNLLTGISGSLDLVQKRLSQGRVGELDRYVIAAQGASRRAAALTHRLLAFSRRQTLDPRPTDVARLIGGMTDLIRRTVGPAVTVETVDMAGLWTALVDPNQLENALLNLAINARDAMPGGGRLTIETGNKWMDDRTARERDLSPGQYLSICVSDNGIGMPPDIVARAFDPFFTTKPLGQGTGLGLSMIYGFARQSNGQVRIYSEVGQGTMVCIYLPRHHGTEDRTEITPAQGNAPDAEVGGTVLMVDDEPTVRMLVADVLSDLGYAALEAEDGASGLRVLRTDARIDLLVTDVGLPGGMNGRQVADAARVLRPGLKVLFITGYAENAVVGNGHLEAGMAVLTKPFSMDDLAAKIRLLIAG